MPSKKVRACERWRCGRACSNCKRRKERRDGRLPCQRYIERGVRAECKPCLQPQSPPMVSALPSPDHELLNGGCVTDNPKDLGTDQSLQSQRQQQHQNATPLPIPLLSRLVKNDRGTSMFIGDSANYTLYCSQRLRGLSMTLSAITWWKHSQTRSRASYGMAGSVSTRTISKLTRILYRVVSALTS
ncbi:hypothetical protein F5884DRAFT_549428 [Xylogone sp. PMI_703]|nr:hypothetical protein F5884DRAFT_549428 [Xylogone sp. PMI_703]